VHFTLKNISTNQYPWSSSLNVRFEIIHIGEAKATYLLCIKSEKAAKNFDGGNLLQISQ
jgi:hypothetical protein